MLYLAYDLRNRKAANANQIASKANSTLMPWTRTRKAKQFKLFRYSSEDYLRGYQASSRLSLTAGVIGDSMTAYGLYEDVKK